MDVRSRLSRLLPRYQSKGFCDHLKVESSKNFVVQHYFLEDLYKYLCFHFLVVYNIFTYLGDLSLDLKNETRKKMKIYEKKENRGKPNQISFDTGKMELLTSWQKY